MDLSAWTTAAGAVAVYGLVVLLCAAGLLLSALTLSGTWLVVAAAAVAALYRDQPFPGGGTILAFALVAAAVEGFEFAASFLGVTRRGGSRWSGVAATLGGLVGLFAGGLVPVPLVGSLVGMAAFSFLGAFLAERHRQKGREQAAHVAWGAVLARVAVVLVKVGATLGLSLVLLVGLAAGR